MNLDVKRAFVLADWMKAASRCESGEEFLSLLDSESLRLASLPEGELDQMILPNQQRLRCFNSFAWTLGSVPLADCYVYPRMGKRLWAEGHVKDVSEKFTRLEPSSSRIWRMKLFASLYNRLPLIVMREGAKLKIDDGSHRAIAMYLSGTTDAKAYIGVPLNAPTPSVR